MPYQVLSGFRYYDRKEVKDMLSYMRLVVNPSDDVSLARMSNPPMTTVHQDIQMKGRLAVQYIMESIDGDNAKKENILPISIVERESVKRL